MSLVQYFIFLFVFGSAITMYAQRNDFADINFKKADSIAASYRNHSLQDLRLLTFNLTHPLDSDVEKFRAIYKWVCDNIKNDYELFLTNKDQRDILKTDAERAEWNKKLGRETFQRLVRHKMTVCTGYAYLIREMSSHAGLAAVIVDGYGRTIKANVEGEGIANHSWNAVQLNSKWYLCDATWSSGAFDLTQHVFIKKYVDGYFLADPKLFIRNHYPLDPKWILFEGYPTLQSFLFAPIIYPTIYRYGIQSLFPETFNQVIQQKSMFNIQLLSANSIDPKKIRVELQNDSGTVRVRPVVENSESGHISISHRIVTKGLVILHLMIDKEHICSYRVQVK